LTLEKTCESRFFFRLYFVADGEFVAVVRVRRVWHESIGLADASTAGDGSLL